MRVHTFVHTVELMSECAVCRCTHMFAICWHGHVCAHGLGHTCRRAGCVSLPAGLAEKDKRFPWPPLLGSLFFSWGPFFQTNSQSSPQEAAEPARPAADPCPQRTPPCPTHSTRVPQTRVLPDDPPGEARPTPSSASSPNDDRKMNWKRQLISQGKHFQTQFYNLCSKMGLSHKEI